MSEFSSLNPEITVVLTDERDKELENNIATFHYPGGVKDFVSYLDSSRHSFMDEPIHIQGEMDNIPVEVAMQYIEGYTENVHSYVHNINTREGGTHISGFIRALRRCFKTYAEYNNMITAKITINFSG